MNRREATMPQILAVVSVVVAGGLFVVGTGAYLYMRFVTARRKPQKELPAEQAPPGPPDPSS
jgi:uncharacterized integral membrane protein